MMTAQEIRAFIEQATEITGDRVTVTEVIVARWLADQKDAGVLALRRFLDAYAELRKERPLPSDETLEDVIAHEDGTVVEP